MSLPFIMPDPFSFSRRVFAHYFPRFPLSIDNKPAASDYYNTQFLVPSGEDDKYEAQGGYLRARPLPVPVQATFSPITNFKLEVQTAIDRGITGFTFDILSLTDIAGNLSNMFAATLAVDPRFAIVPMFDMSALVDITQDEIVEAVASFISEPSLLREPDGRAVFAAFNPTQPLAFWQGVISALNVKNIDVAFIPVLLGSPATSEYDPISIGIGGWGTPTPQASLLPASYMTPVSPQGFRPKDAKFWEASNFDTYRNAWSSAIAGAQAGTTQYVQLITWNDFSEGAQVQPCTDATLAPNIGTGFYDLTAYYTIWFLTGAPPKIAKDFLYFCYRRMNSSAAHLEQADNFVIAAGSGPEEDNIELLAFLTEPGVIVIDGQTMSAPAGITSFKVPSVPGNPTFALQRNGSNVQQGVGPVQIYGPEGSPAGTTDMTYWSGSI